MTLVILLTLKTLSISGCDKGLDVKLYRLDSDRGGLVRSQDDEFYSCSDQSVDGYVCISKEDFTTLVNSCLEESGVPKESRTSIVDLIQ